MDGFLGIDLGGSKIEIIALDTHGHCLHRTRVPTPTNQNPNQYQAILDQLQTLVEQTEHKLGCQGWPLGLGIPGAISESTGLIKNANTTCLIGQDLKGDLIKRLKRPVKLENDANCFAISEATDGAGQGFDNVFAVILGTGVGGGWVIHQRAIIGANRIAGEWGHNPLPWQNPQDLPQQSCYCGQQGCIETYLSGPGFARQAQLQYQINLDSQGIINHKANHEKARQAYDDYVNRLGRSLANIINIMDPEVIVLGGGLSNINSLYEDVPKAWQQYVFSNEPVQTKLIKNSHGDSSGVRGAAWLSKQ